ncbi:LVIVD repeat-containing protein [Haloarcula nitratireducens]|uniref:LVIVD repeat-containing protein n=1 Tax=Haloarcula nitratireducens TaxID=2487749 RepID=A0AAW4PAZ2_9EURY|nr:hypothetical protein [Halomicroarcula nitratireducens]MBX0295266.1 hypothetical protein [Halomicroarcula nitratireducens]
MRRRTFLRALGAGTAGVGTATGAAGAHPLPTDKGTPATPGDTPTGSDVLGTLDLPGARELVTSPDGHTAYVATGGGVAFVDVVSPTAPRLIEHRTDLLAESEDGPMRIVQDVAVADDRLLVAGPAHPTDGAHGFVVFDVSDRENPERVLGYETATRVHNCDFDGRYAYLTANGRDGNPLLVVDTDREREVGTWSLLDADEAWAEVPAGLRPLHDVWVQDGRAYLAYWDAGTWILDVTDPADISLISRVRGREPSELSAVDDPGLERTEPPGNDHYVTVNDDATLLGVGAESWDGGDDGSGGPSGIELFDVSEPTEPESLATIAPPPTDDPTPGGVLTTAHNFELADGRCYSAWYMGGVRVHDLSDPADPREVFSWRDSESTSFWTAQRAAGCFLASNTNANAGSEAQPGVYAFPDPRVEPSSETAEAVGGDSSLVGAAGDGFGIAAALAGLAGVGLAGLFGRKRDS